MQKWTLPLAGLGLACSIATGLPTTASAETINALFMTQAAYSDSDIRAMTDEFQKANPGVSVNLEFVPYEGLYDKIVAAKAAGGSGYDVVLFDVIWPAAFAQDQVLLDVSDRLKTFDQSKVFEGAWATVKYSGKILGMPWILDTKYLFYNTDIMKAAGIATPPKTWDELAKDAKLIKDKGLLQYPIVGSWSQAEAVICDYTTIAAAYGGGLYKGDKPAFADGGSLDAVKWMASALKDGIANPNSKEYSEEDVRKVFSAGDAAFALNWTYMYAKANDPAESKIVGKIGVEPAPGVATTSTASAVNGSMGLGIAAGSTHPDTAWKYISFLTSQPEQNKFAQLSLPLVEPLVDLEVLV